MGVFAMTFNPVAFEIELTLRNKMLNHHQKSSKSTVNQKKKKIAHGDIYIQMSHVEHSGD